MVKGDGRCRRVLDDGQKKRIKAAVASGVFITDVARRFSVSTDTIRKVLDDVEVVNARARSHGY